MKRYNDIEIRKEGGVFFILCYDIINRKYVCYCHGGIRWTVHSLKQLPIYELKKSKIYKRFDSDYKEYLKKWNDWHDKNGWER